MEQSGSSGARTAAPAFSVLITAFNEDENMRPVIDEIYEALPPAPPFEVVVVDDGSTDRTAEILEAAGARYSSLVVVTHERRMGKSAALRSGAKRANADWLLMMDGDGQNDPRDAARLFAAAQGDVALAAGLRRRRRDTLAKRLSSRFANRLRQWLLKDGCRDTGCGLKLIRKRVFLALPYFDSIHRFIPALVRHYGHRVTFVEVEDRPRLHGQSKYTNLRRAIVGLFDLFGVVWLMRRTPTPAPPQWSEDAVTTSTLDEMAKEDSIPWLASVSGGTKSPR
jgi:dolichol-phosphate mannosyltransferase